VDSDNCHLNGTISSRSYPVKNEPKTQHWRRIQENVQRIDLWRRCI